MKVLQHGKAVDADARLERARQAIFRTGLICPGVIERTHGCAMEDLGYIERCVCRAAAEAVIAALDAKQ